MSVLSSAHGRQKGAEELMSWKMDSALQILKALFISKDAKDLEVRVVYKQRDKNLGWSSEANRLIMHASACFKDIYWKEVMAWNKFSWVVL